MGLGILQGDSDLSLSARNSGQVLNLPSIHPPTLVRFTQTARTQFVFVLLSHLKPLTLDLTAVQTEIDASLFAHSVQTVDTAFSSAVTASRILLRLNSYSALTGS